MPDAIRNETARYEKVLNQVERQNEKDLKDIRDKHKLDVERSQIQNSSTKEELDKDYNLALTMQKEQYEEKLAAIKKQNEESLEATKVQGDEEVTNAKSRFQEMISKYEEQSKKKLAEMKRDYEEQQTILKTKYDKTSNTQTSRKGRA